MNAFSFPSHRNPLPIHPVCVLRSAETPDPQDAAPGLHQAGPSIHIAQAGRAQGFSEAIKIGNLEGLWKALPLQNGQEGSDRSGPLAEAVKK